MTAYQSFVDLELALLEAYDNLRPAGHPYAFHLHVRRVADDMRALALAMGNDKAEAALLQTLTLAHDIGKRLLPVAIWDVDGKPDEATRRQRRRHCQLGVDIVNEAFGADNDDDAIVLLRDLIAHHHDVTYPGMSVPVRMLCICDAFDGYSTWRPHFGNRDISPAAVLHRMSVEKSGQFDSAILSVFATLKGTS